MNFLIKSALRKADKQEYKNPKFISEIIYETTRNKKKANRVLIILRNAVRYIVLSDYYIETGKEIYRKVAKEVEIEFLDFLDHEQLVIWQSSKEKIIKPYWKYENGIKKKLQNKHIFSKKEIREFVYKRSSDSIIYSKLAFSNNPKRTLLIKAFHNRQGLEDIVDCVIDYSEDLKSGEPNLIFLCFLNQKINKKLWPKSFGQAKKSDTWPAIRQDILNLAIKLQREALANSNIKKFKWLEKDINYQYNLLCELL